LWKTRIPAIYGQNNGLILNMADKLADGSRNGVMQIAAEQPDRMLKEISKLVMPTTTMLKQRMLI
jgi:hypothetical protein